jgi:hypothetical protein
MNDSIIIINGSKATSLINKLQDLILLENKNSSVVYESSNNKVQCHTTSSFTNKVDSFIKKNNTFTYKSLLSYLNDNGLTVSNVILSGYLKKKNCVKINYKTLNGNYMKLWTKNSF